MNAKNGAVMTAMSTSASRLKQNRKSLWRIFSILLFAVFVVVDLLALLIGTTSYGSLNRMQTENDQRIMSLGPIVSSVRANDVTGGVAVGAGPEGRALVMVQSDISGTYETRIYLYEGKIVQEYALASSPYTPTKATELSPSETFEFSYDDGLLSITTDAGTAEVALRNLQGGA